MKQLSFLIYFSLAVTFVAAESEHKLNVQISIKRIQDQINVTKTNPANWTALPEIIKKGLSCLSPATFKLETTELPFGLVEYIEQFSPASLAQEIASKVNWKKVAAKRSSGAPLDFWEDLGNFMATPSFQTIHEHIWSDAEFQDLVAYMYEAGYPGIYEAIKAFYTQMGSSLDVPSGPPTQTFLHSKAQRRATDLPTPAQKFPVILKSPIINECGANDLLGILGMIHSANLHHVLKLVVFIAQEVGGNSGMQVLLLKLGEPHKGAFFHDTLLLPEMQQALPLVQGLVLSDPGIAQLNEILNQVTGLDLGNQKLFTYIINLIEYLVWNYPFPA